jgi:hypothetical protein
MVTPPPLFLQEKAGARGVGDTYVSAPGVSPPAVIVRGRPGTSRVAPRTIVGMGLLDEPRSGGAVPKSEIE